MLGSADDRRSGLLTRRSAGIQSEARSQAARGGHAANVGLGMLGPSHGRRCVWWRAGIPQAMVMDLGFGVMGLEGWTGAVPWRHVSLAARLLGLPW